MDEFDKLVEKEVPEYRKIPFDRITPNLLLKFSKAFEQIISHSNSYNSADCPVGDSQPHKNTETVFYYIKQAYESFIKRIVGISDLSETEQVLKKWLELSSPKFSANPTKEDPDNTKNKRFVKSYSVLIEEHKELLESNAELAKDFKNTKLKMENDLKEYSKRKAEQLKKMKAIIRQLKLKLEDVSKTEVSVSKYNKLKDNVKILVQENEELNNTAWKLKDLVDDLNQKKNKLNFLIFLCMKEGYPVNKIYKNEVKPIDSHRFEMLTPSKIKNSIKKMNENSNSLNKKSKSDDAILKNPENKNASMNESFEQLAESFFDEVEESQILNKSHDTPHNYSVDLNWSYEPLAEGSPIMPKKLKIIPSLNFNKLDEYTKAVKDAKKKKMEEKKKQHGEQDDLNFDELESILKSS